MPSLPFPCNIAGIILVLIFHTPGFLHAQGSLTVLPRDDEARRAATLAASVIPPTSSTTDILRLAGEYNYGNGFDMNCTLEISPDGRFVYKKCNCENIIDQASGVASIENGVISLTPDKPRSQWPRGTASQLIPVTWGQRLYLVPQDDILGFSNHVNRGTEPVSRGSMGSYYLREGDWDRPVTGKPELPSEWKERLLDEPLHGQIAGKDPSGRWIMNLGRKHGVYDHMELSAWQPDLQRFVTIVVTETGTDTSAIKIVGAPPDLRILDWIVYSQVVPPKKQ